MSNSRRAEAVHRLMARYVQTGDLIQELHDDMIATNVGPVARELNFALNDLTSFLNRLEKIIDNAIDTNQEMAIFTEIKKSSHI